MKKAKKARNNNPKSFPSDVDVVITDYDPASHMTTPGMYAVMDVERGVMETIEVTRDGAQRVVKSQPVPLPNPSPATEEATGNAAPQFRVLAVGQPYFSDRADWEEGVRVNIAPDGVELAIFFEDPTAKEIAEIQSGRVAMRLITASQTMVFLLRLGSGLWQEAFYGLHRVPVAERGCPPDPGQGYGWMATIVTVNARTGVVAAIRQLALSRRFSCAILLAFEEQTGRAADDATHVREVTRFQTKSTAALAAEANDRFEQGDTAN
ncbi:MAG: hypothetical protein ABI548_03460 [Polyangiaceae bacterium]